MCAVSYGARVPILFHSASSNCLSLQSRKNSQFMMAAVYRDVASFVCNNRPPHHVRIATEWTLPGRPQPLYGTSFADEMSAWKKY